DILSPRLAVIGLSHWDLSDEATIQEPAWATWCLFGISASMSTRPAGWMVYERRWEITGSCIAIERRSEHSLTHTSRLKRASAAGSWRCQTALAPPTPHQT